MYKDLSVFVRDFSWDRLSEFPVIMTVLCLAMFMGWLCLVHVYVCVVSSCSVCVLMLLYDDLLIICYILQGLTKVTSFEERRSSNGSIGFSTGSPSLDRQL